MRNALPDGTNAAVRSFAALLILLLISMAPSSVRPVDLVTQTVCDLQVLYLFEEPETIDWPTLYYLNEETGCRIDLLTLSAGNHMVHTVDEVPDRGIFVHQYNIKPGETAFVDTLLAVQFGVRRPDIVIMGAPRFEGLLADLATALESLPARDNSIFNVRKIYRYAPTENDQVTSSSAVTVNRRELYARYRDRMQLEIGHLFPWLQTEQFTEVGLSRYELVRRYPADNTPDPDFLSGLERLRMITVFDTVLADGALKNSFVNRARNVISFFNLSRKTVGAPSVDNLIAGYKALGTLVEQTRSEPLLTGIGDLQPYMERLYRHAQKAVLTDIGMSWDGNIILRDSPHGPKLKFRASLSVNGPKFIELSYIRFHPYWDSADVILDSVSRQVEPHQSFVREYLVDIERGYLEATMPESLLFSAEIVYGSMPLTVTSSVPIWESPDITIAFAPDFFFVPPVARLEVDKVVSSMNWKAVISKPLYYHGTANLDLEAPRGVYAGAYRQSWQLEKGRATETVRIPFSVSNLFELGIHEQKISLSIEGREVASATGKIRIAACRVSDSISVGLMPDTTGLLEDILRMSGANYWPLTDRSLQTGDLDAYNVIVMGPGAVRSYPSFKKIRGRLEDYLRYGGSLVILGQPNQWPEGALPVGFVPTTESINASELLNRIPEARVMSQPYAISQSNLFNWFAERKTVNPAVISPAEKVFVTPTGATLLSVSRLGEGQMIFCGLPLIEMISDLNIEAIHLLANILNY
ncbi:MAG: hypothetical protein GY867_05185 [bacterium]|nr:hypothetical protein [bacterium]